MRRDRRLLAVVALAVLGCLLLLAGVGAALAALLQARMGDRQWREFSILLEPHLPLLIFIVPVLAVGVGWLVLAAYQTWVQGPARLLERAQGLIASEHGGRLEHGHAQLERQIAAAINTLVQQRSDLQGDVQARVRDASRAIEQERERLAALMSELAQSVVVCNLDGLVLLYNSRARLQFRAMSQAPSLAGGAELLGLGRSIYRALDRQLIAHALQGVVRRIERGAEHPVSTFMTATRSGQLLRVQLAPVRETDPGQDLPALAGFVLVLENMTRELEQQLEDERLLRRLGQGLLASKTRLQLVTALLQQVGLPDRVQEPISGTLDEESRAIAHQLDALAARDGRGAFSHWPLEPVLASDLLRIACQRIEASSALRCTLIESGAQKTSGDRSRSDSHAGPDAASQPVLGAPRKPESELWLNADSFSLLQVFESLALQLHADLGVEQLVIELSADLEQIGFALCWPSAKLHEPDIVESWAEQPIVIAGQPQPFTIREIIERHRGEFLYDIDRVTGSARFLMLLPRAQPLEALDSAMFVKTGSRPEFYDFDLFRPAHPDQRVLDDCELDTLSFTVFDTETTGLDPSSGDEIIQIGAVRVLNGRLLHAEAFEQLIDPGRPIPMASIPIHGIEQHMVEGKPRIQEVLPAFHAYVEGTVLVAHNAAFDLRFLELKQDEVGLRFDQPVLDTLLLSALVHPNQSSHKLESIAERFGIPVIGRHTALGDAILTAEVLLRLIPLLREQGIRTLAQAREAARTTYYARLRY